MKKRSVLLISLLACAMLIEGCTTSSFSFSKKTEEVEEDKRITVKVDTPKTASISIEGDFIGDIESEEQVYVVSKLSGDVTETFFEVGDYVNAGDLMYTIDDTAAQISYKQAQASLSSANASLNTAMAGVNTANANVNATTASVTENFAKTTTNDKQLQLGIDKANVDYANAEINIGVLEDSLNKLMNNIYSSQAKLEEALNMKAALENQYVATKDASLLPKIQELEGNITTLNSTLESLDSNRKQLQANIDTANNSKCLLVENEDIARSQKGDYDNYTKNTIGTGGLASLASAQAGVAQAEAGVVQSKAGITQAQAAVDAAQLQLDYANVTAPVSGIITSKGVTKNNMTSTGSVGYTIMSEGNKYVVFYVSEEIMNSLYEGQSISLDRNGTNYDAVITENPGVVDSQNGLFKVKALVNAGDQLVNGVKVKITMMTQHADDVMTVPIDAVYHESEKSYVYSYDNGKAKKLYVETGLFNDEVIEIISGLNDSDKIITTWSSQLRDGVEVNVSNSGASVDNKSDDILVERD